MRLVEIWDSRENYDRWMDETIQPAIQKVAGAPGHEAAAQHRPHGSLSSQFMRRKLAS